MRCHPRSRFVLVCSRCYRIDFLMALSRGRWSTISSPMFWIMCWPSLDPCRYRLDGWLSSGRRFRLNRRRSPAIIVKVFVVAGSACVPLIGTYLGMMIMSWRLSSAIVAMLLRETMHRPIESQLIDSLNLDPATLPVFFLPERSGSTLMPSRESIANPYPSISLFSISWRIHFANFSKSFLASCTAPAWEPMAPSAGVNLKIGLRCSCPIGTKER